MSWQGPYTVHGRMDGEDVTITWDDGQLSGTDAAVAAVRSVLDSQDRVQLSPQDEERVADVRDPLATMAAIQQVMEIVDVSGDVPIPDPDDSAS